MNQLIEGLKKWLSESEEVKAYWDKINSGKATYQDALGYGGLVANKVSAMLEDEYEGDVDLSPVIDEIKADYTKAYKESAYYAKSVQKVINKSNNIGIRAIEPEIDEDRIEHILTKLVDEDADWLLGSDVVENIARQAVMDTVKANAKFHEEAGLHAYMSRSGSGCCAWCAEVSGTYEYGDQPDDFFRSHKGCTCIIHYQPRRGKLQNLSWNNEIGKFTE